MKIPKKVSYLKNYLIESNDKTITDHLFYNALQRLAIQLDQARLDYKMNVKSMTKQALKNSHHQGQIKMDDSYIKRGETHINVEDDYTYQLIKKY
jgi:hypothetical protein